MTVEFWIAAVAVAIAFGVGAGLVWFYARAGRLRLEASLAQVEERAASAEQNLEKERTGRHQLEVEVSALTASRDSERAAEEDKIKLLQDAEKRLVKEMEALSRKALDRNAKSFIEVAREQFDHLLTKADAQGAKRKADMDKLVEPLGKSLEEVRTHLKEVEKTRTEAYVSLTEQVKSLSASQAELQKEASNLVSALRKPEVRGRWGEIQLRRVVEMAGMEAFCDFEEQHTVQTDDGHMRPDLVVRLPAERIIVVDAKVPLEAYLDGVATDDEIVRKASMRRHVSQIRDHIRKLGAKAYSDQFPTTPDMVVMFLPGESFYYAALQEDPTLLEYGVGNNVVVATPMTLIALLRAIAYGWRQERVADNARKISDLGQELYDRICVMADNFARVGSGLSTAVTNYNKTVGSLESRVLVSARKFRDLGSGSTREVPEVEPVEAITRSIESPELKPPALPPGPSVPAEAKNGDS